MSGKTGEIRTLDAVQLRRAMVARDISTTTLADRAKVDPDTVQRALMNLPLHPRSEARILRALRTFPVVSDIHLMQKELAG